MRILIVVFTGFIALSCSNKGGSSSPFNTIENEALSVSCQEARYPNYQESPYVLPYPVGDSYVVNLNHCSISPHGPGDPDQFAVDFDMPIGSMVTAARGGRVVYVEASGQDGNYPNNAVIIQAGSTYDIYAHLTFNGALVEIGDSVTVGQEIGLSGATGAAGYAHLHFVVTQGSWQWPYESVPYNFRNTQENPHGPEIGEVYTALPY
ncbi:MAG: M23 family metallopeptidase [Dokdonia sp.]|jgi:hypothetical protein|nr:metalloendopeptidase [Cytophagaceae bacterium]